VMSRSGMSGSIWGHACTGREKRYLSSKQRV
jgi:hypothetical protein